MAPRKRGEGRTPHRTFRAEDDRWDAFTSAVAKASEDRTAVLNDFIAWYAHWPGAKLPKRPDPHVDVPTCGAQSPSGGPPCIRPLHHEQEIQPGFDGHLHWNGNRRWSPKRRAE